MLDAMSDGGVMDQTSEDAGGAGSAAELVFPLASILATARDYLDIDVVFLTHLHDGGEVFLFGDGDVHSFGPITEGATFPLSESYCNRVISDCLPNVVPDARSHDVTADLEVTEAAGIGSYIGIPISLSDGSVYGTFCCMSHRNGDAPTDDQLGVMRLLAELAAREIERRALDRNFVLQLRVSRALTATARVEDALNEALAVVGGTLDCASAAIWVAEPGASGARRRAWWSSALDTAAGPEDGPAGTASDAVLRALSSHAVERENAAPEGVALPEAVLVVPIVSDDARTAGAVELRPAPSGDEILPALVNVGAQIAEFLAGSGHRIEPGPLTPRELQVLELAANGASVDEAAKVLYLSPATVRTHLRRIYAKLGAANKAAAVAEGMRRNLIA
jgi:DNA-binding CsgD family transcriptional regulator